MRYVLLFGACLLCSCILVDSLSDKSLEANVIVPPDAVFNVFGEIRIASSLVLDPQQTTVLWSPAFLDFGTAFSATRDTVILTLTEDLAYATTYQLILVDSSRVREGAPLRDTLSLRTVEGESEWNNTPSTADTLRAGQPLAGNINFRPDTDWFWLLPDFVHDSALVVLNHLFADIDLNWLDSDSLSSRGVSANRGTEADTVRVAFSATPALLRVGAKPDIGTGSRYRITALPY